jgi:hypothetical protein
MVRIMPGKTRFCGIPPLAMKPSVPAKLVIFEKPDRTKITTSKMRPIRRPASCDPFIVPLP